MQIRRTNGIWIADDDTLPQLSVSELSRPPIKLLLSLAGSCNLRCFHCLGSSEELVRSSQDFSSASRELVDFIVDRVMPDVRAVRLGGIGLTEELTSSTFDYFLERVEPHAPRLGSFELITNLSLMTPERAERMASSLTDVQVSIEGIGDNFTRIRGFPWRQLVDHVQMLCEARLRSPASRMKITLLACAMNDTLDDLLRFDVFQSMGVDAIILRELAPLAAQHQSQVLYRDPERAREFVQEFRRRAEKTGIEALITIADRYDPSPPGGGQSANPDRAGAGRRPELRRCALPFEVLSVVHTGRFGVCPYITDLAAPAADLSTLSIVDVWNSPGFVELRKTVNSSSPPRTCLGCEMKVGHLSEAERTQVQLVAERDALRAEVSTVREAWRAEVAALREHLEVIEADRAARLDVIHDQGRRLGETQAQIADLREDAEERRQLIRTLTHQVQTLERQLHAIQATRVYHWLRRLGRWQFGDDEPPNASRRVR